MKATEEEVRQFKNIRYQKEALLELLGHIKEEEHILWKALEKKYNLDEKQRYILDRGTREIKKVF